MDRRPCMCLGFGTIKEGQVGAPEEGLSGFEVGLYRAFCHLPWSPFCRSSQMFDIIVGVWGVEGLLGE